jgi:hypothetical protein
VSGWIVCLNRSDTRKRYGRSSSLAPTAAIATVSCDDGRTEDADRQMRLVHRKSAAGVLLNPALPNACVPADRNGSSMTFQNSLECG